MSFQNENFIRNRKTGMGLHLGGLIIGRSVASEIWGAYFREGLFGGGGEEGSYRNFMVHGDGMNSFWNEIHSGILVNSPLFLAETEPRLNDGSEAI